MCAVRVLLIATMILWIGIGAARADVALLMEEPYGTFGAFNPTGHAAVYLDHVCAESPTRLRRCRSGEAGVVISRYHKIGNLDWIAIPLVPYLYAVERQEDVPPTVDKGLEMRLRDTYRRQHLLEIAPNLTEDRLIPHGDWIQLVGASYDRTIYGFQLETASVDDERLIARFNDKRNVSHFNLFFHNCADFSRVLINGYYPHAVRRNFIADLGMTTPKGDAKSLTKYAKRHPQLAFSTFVIPQIPGTLPRSKSVDGVAEALVKSKKYVALLAIFGPELTTGLAVSYLVDGRIRPPTTERSATLPQNGESVSTPTQKSP